jgi:hypothetical protein
VTNCLKGLARNNTNHLTNTRPAQQDEHARIRYDLAEQRHVVDVSEREGIVYQRGALARASQCEVPSLPRGRKTLCLKRFKGYFDLQLLKLSLCIDT